MESPFANIVKKQTGQHQTRLPFVELCGFYASLLDGVSPALVARASGLAVTTVGNLRAAGQHHAGQLRYPKIAAELAKLGRAEFIHRYATPAIVERLVAADRGAALPQRANAGVNPRADAYAGKHWRADKETGGEEWFEIGLVADPACPGWAWRDRWHAGVTTNGCMWRGDPRRQERRFPRSRDAFNFYLLRRFPTKRQINEGLHAEANDDSYFFSLDDSQKYFK